ncbi:hypothetical protein HSBAA_60030 [Vreelandella sulfidaeris]|uniref:Aminotransferase class III-fold pyridoxal phosphate-dependent enzyme n=1 Tax=Vreelandella sulfidaeris TaxID=115553 RepID=A0A455UG68_9GAMM|nr:hypothetical protein HSBAA_60030 [Halomonas sulfidaeris]
MAAIVATLDAMEEEGIVENADNVGNGPLAEGLKRLAECHPIIGDWRGVGVFHALELVSDPVRKTPLPGTEVLKLKQLLMEQGLLVFTVENRIHVVPPCIVTPEEVEEGLAILARVFEGYTASLQ